MKHAKHVFKVGRTGSHRRCMIANLLKDLLNHGRISTSVAIAKELRRHADRVVTMSKKDTLAATRRACAKMMIRFNPLTSKQAREAKKGNLSSYNGDRTALKRFRELKGRYEDRNGGYTRIVLGHERQGDASKRCFIELI